MAAGAGEADIARNLAALPVAEPEPEIELVADEEGASASLFLALGTQWRTAGSLGLLTGLDYAAIEPTARIIGVHLVPSTFLDLRHMEAEALKTFAEQRPK